MKNIIISSHTKRNVLATAFCMLAASIPFHATYAAPGGATVTSPPFLTGVTIVPRDQLRIPDVLKNQGKLEQTQMTVKGYIDATEDEVSYLDRVKEDKDKQLHSMAKVAPKLNMDPANLAASPLGKAVLLGATENGAYIEREGWTGLDRIFVVPKLGLVLLEEEDFVASHGGMAFIKEAINQDVNGFPAILSVRQSRSNKGLTELTWATDQKIYTLSTNRALKDQTAVDEFLEIARSIF